VTTEPPLDVQISLVSTNSRDLLRNCLVSLPAACDCLVWKAAVVDNASDDGTAEMVNAEFPAVALLRNTARQGFSANHNQIIRLGLERGAEFVLVLNEDTVLEPMSVTSLVSFSRDDLSIGAAGPVIRGSDGEIQRSLFAFPTIASEVSAGFRPGRERRAGDDSGWLNGSCVLVKLEAIREVGLLDDRFFIFFEDTDLGLRLARAGWRSSVCRQARILHLGHQVVSQPVYGDRMERQMIRSRYLYFRKHFRPSRAALVMGLSKLAFAARAGKAAAAAALTHQPAERALAGSLWKLAVYNPRLALQHERGETHSSA
jgi:GT2 family glycosyltransferase